VRPSPAAGLGFAAAAAAALIAARGGRRKTNGEDTLRVTVEGSPPRKTAS
jgi:hypothetical protein